MRRTFFTRDRAATPILVAGQIGARRWTTPEGFLFIEGVPIARLGEMLYRGDELPVIEPDRQGMVRITRDEAALFDARTLASFHGKPIIDEHPEEPDGSAGEITAKNYALFRDRIHGDMLNPRRGLGTDADVLLVDFLVKTAAGIKLINDGKTELSAGYTGEYEQVMKGLGRQMNIIGNHVALVERGRCGPRCAIGDRLPTNFVITKENGMAGESTQTTPRRKAVVIDRLAAGIAEVLGQELGGDEVDEEEDGQGAQHIHIHQGAAPNATATNDADKARIDSLEKTVTELKAGQNEQTSLLQQLLARTAPGGTVTNDGVGDPEPEDSAALPAELTVARGIKTGDSAALGTSFQAVVSDAEVLAPGYRMPAFDSKARRAVTLDSMCGLRRGVLKHVGNTTEGAQMLAGLGGGDVDLDKGTCVEVANLFRSAAQVRRMTNNSRVTNDANRVPDNQQSQPVKKVTPADLQKANDAFWAQQPAA